MTGQPNQNTKPAEERRKIVKESAYSPSAMMRDWSDGSHDFVCTWPGCGYSNEKIGSVGSHYRGHSGKAAQRRRGERPAKTGQFADVVKCAFAIVDLANEMITKLEAIEADIGDAMEARQELDAIRDLLK